MRALGAILCLAIAGCGGSSAAPASTTTSSTSRPVRVDEPQTETTEATRPVRVETPLPGQVAESDDLADPPPVEAPSP